MKHCSASFSPSSRGRPPSSASMLTPKLICSWVKRYSWFSTTSGVASRFSSIDDAHAGAVALVAQVGDAFDLLGAHQFGDALQQGASCSPGRGFR